MSTPIVDPTRCFICAGSVAQSEITYLLIRADGIPLWKKEMYAWVVHRSCIKHRIPLPNETMEDLIPKHPVVHGYHEADTIIWKVKKESQKA